MIEENKILWKYHEGDDRKVAAAVREGDIDTILPVPAGDFWTSSSIFSLPWASLR